MKGERTVSPIISFGLIGVFLALLVIGLFLGLLRGTLKSLIRLLAVVVAFAVSLAICLQVAPNIEAVCRDKNVLELLESFGIAAVGNADIEMMLSHLDAATLQHLLMVPTSVIAVPIMFVLLFFLISLVLLILLWLLCLIMRIGKGHKTATSRFIGMGIGILQSILVGVVVFTPVVGALDTVAAISESECVTAEPGQPIFNEEGKIDLGALVVDVGSSKNSLVPTVFGSIGSRSIFGAFTNVTVAANAVNLQDEAVGLAEIGFELLRLDYFNPIDISDEHKDAIRDMLAAIDKSPYAERTLAGVMRAVSDAYVSGDIVLIAKEPYFTIIDTVLRAFEGSTNETVTQDFKTVADLYIMMSEERFFYAVSESDKATRSMFVRKNAEGEMVIDRMIDILDSNPRMGRLLSVVGEISISMMSNNISFSDDQTKPVYNEVKTGLGETLSIPKEDYATEEEYVEAVSESIEEVLTSSGIELEPEIYKSMAEYVNQNYQGGTAPTDEDINRLLISYYAAYAPTE